MVLIKSVIVIVGINKCIYDLKIGILKSQQTCSNKKKSCKNTEILRYTVKNV